MSPRARLRVGVDVSLTRVDPRTGHGRVWRNVLANLQPLVDLRTFDPGRSSLRRPGRLDVVLGDGHALPVASRARLVVQLHEASWDEPATFETVDPGFGDHIARVTSIAVQQASAIITASESSRRQVIDYYSIDPSQVRAIPHGVDPAIFRPGRAGGRHRVSQKLAADRPYVLYVGSLHPRKNLPILRAAMAEIIGAGRPHALVLAVSASPDRADSSALLAAAAAELPGAASRIAVFTGLDDGEIADIMANCDAFCLPSETEGFGLTVLEAMSCGAAVVAADRGALPEVVGDAGVLAEPNVAALSQAIAALLDDDNRRTQLAAAARERAGQLTWQRTAQGWLEVLALAAERKM